MAMTGTIITSIELISKNLDQSSSVWSELYYFKLASVIDSKNKIINIARSIATHL